jgi:hypothetical protein
MVSATFSKSVYSLSAVCCVFEATHQSQTDLSQLLLMKCLQTKLSCVNNQMNLLVQLLESVVEHFLKTGVTNVVRSQCIVC